MYNNVRRIRRVIMSRYDLPNKIHVWVKSYCNKLREKKKKKKSQSLIKPESVNRTKCFSNSSRSPLASHIKCRSTFNRGRNDVLMHSCTCFTTYPATVAFSRQNVTNATVFGPNACRTLPGGPLVPVHRKYDFTITRRGATYSQPFRIHLHILNVFHVPLDSMTFFFYFSTNKMTLSYYIRGAFFYSLFCYTTIKIYNN